VRPCSQTNVFDCEVREDEASHLLPRGRCGVSATRAAGTSVRRCLTEDSQAREGDVSVSLGVRYSWAHLLVQRQEPRALAPMGWSGFLVVHGAVRTLAIVVLSEFAPHEQC
jgi:hypothetical protein